MGIEYGGAISVWDEGGLILRFLPDVAHVREARRFVREAIAPWGAASLGEVALMTAEVVTNAVVHGRTPVTLRVSCAGIRGRVEVHDDSPELPRPHTVSGNCSRGRGLQILDALASDWGVSPTADHGKIVWFEFPIARQTATRSD